MPVDTNEYECPELGPCPFCGGVLLVRQSHSVWDRDQFPDGVRISNKAFCSPCGFELKGFGSNLSESEFLHNRDTYYSEIKAKLLEKWSYRQENRTFVVSEKDFNKRPEEALKLRVFGNVAVTKKDAPRTAAPLLFFEQHVG